MGISARDQQPPQLTAHRRRHHFGQRQRRSLGVVDRDLRRRLFRRRLRADRDRAFHAMTVAWPSANRVAVLLRWPRIWAAAHDLGDSPADVRHAKHGHVPYGWPCWQQRQHRWSYAQLRRARIPAALDDRRDTPKDVCHPVFWRDGFPPHPPSGRIVGTLLVCSVRTERRTHCAPIDCCGNRRSLRGSRAANCCIGKRRNRRRRLTALRRS